LLAFKKGGYAMKSDKEIIEALVATGWIDKDARLGIRANFKCEYCDKDLLSSVESYKAWEKDHIIPKEQGGDDSDENLAISCNTCQFKIKGRWNPKEVCENGATRDELIKAVRIYIAKKRTDLLKEVAHLREIVYSN
jgi:hypothetical protein